jgi:hypothetical protein
MVEAQRMAYEAAAGHVTARGNERRMILQYDADRW